jgi:hypothetical protein
MQVLTRWGLAAALYPRVGLVAEASADGDLVTALGATAAEDCGTCLGLHASEEAVGLGAVAAVRLKGTLRHDKNSCGRRGLLHKLLAIAAISEYTRGDGIFTADCACVFWVGQESRFQDKEGVTDRDVLTDGVFGFQRDGCGGDNRADGTEQGGG